MTRDIKIRLLELLQEKENRIRYNKLKQFYLDEGKFRRELYSKHIAFMNAGSRYRERALFGANRSGKSVTAAFEVACHLTGLYPDWWQGKRFNQPIDAICLGKSHYSVTKVIQKHLCGNFYDLGSGFIPKNCLEVGKCKAKPNTPNAFSLIVTKHFTNGVFDGYSTCDLMSYEAGADVLQGDSRHVTWEDEENPDPEIHSELITRTATVGGISLITFTPRKGWTPIVLSFLPERSFPKNNITTVQTERGPVDRYVALVDWEDAPHLDEQAKAEMLASYQPWEIECRSKGVPSAGKGKVYTTMESSFVVEPFKIPFYWPKAYGLDVGYKCTAAIFVAYDEDNDTYYIYDEYYSQEKLPLIHATAIRHKAGDWMYGLIDPTSAGLGKAKDGIGLLQEYRNLGLNVVEANNAVEAGIAKVQNLLSSGRLKCFSKNSNFLNEYRMYARDDEGKVIKEGDHAMDATKYVFSRFHTFARTPPDPDDERDEQMRLALFRSNKNSITGY